MEKPYKLLYPMRVCLVAASHQEKENFMPAAWVYPVSAEPPKFAVAIAKQRYTYDIIQSSGYFTINVPGFDLALKIEKFGRLSGKDGDKFKAWGVSKEKSEKIPSISIAETLYTLECKLDREVELGDHSLFIGDLINVKTRKEGKGVYQSQKHSSLLEI